MKNITDELKNIINDNTTNLVRCWKFTLKNNEILSFTTASEDFTYDGIQYNHISADDVKDLESNLDIENDSFQFSNLISSDLINSNDILSGKYDGAKVEIFIVDLLNLDKGKVSLLNGKISDIQLKNNIFIANVNGLKNELNKIIGDVYSPICRACFCDNKCKLNKNNFTFSGNISNIKDNTTFYTDDSIIISKGDGYFTNGVIEFTSGNNNGQKTEIKQFSSGLFILASELPYALEINDSFNILAGCDKKFETCCSRFNNAINFRGEPHLPGIELLLKVM